MDQEVEAEMAVQGGPVFGKKQGGRSLFEDMDRPEYSRTPALDIMRNMHMGAQLAHEQQLGKEAHEARLWDARNQWRIPVEQAKIAGRLEEIEAKLAGTKEVAGMKLDAAADTNREKAEALMELWGLRTRSAESIAARNVAGRRETTGMRTDSAERIATESQAGQTLRQKMGDQADVAQTEMNILGRSDQTRQQGENTLALERLRQEGNLAFGQANHGWTVEEKAFDQLGDLELETLRGVNQRLRDQSRQDAKDAPLSIVNDLLRDRAAKRNKMLADSQTGTGETAPLPADIPPAVDHRGVIEDLLEMGESGAAERYAQMAGKAERVDPTLAHPGMRMDPVESEAVGAFWKAVDSGKNKEQAFNEIMPKYAERMTPDARERMRKMSQYSGSTKDVISRVRNYQAMALDKIGPATDLEKSIPKLAQERMENLNKLVIEYAEANHDREAVKLYKRDLTPDPEREPKATSRSPIPSEAAQEPEPSVLAPPPTTSAPQDFSEAPMAGSEPPAAATSTNAPVKRRLLSEKNGVKIYVREK
jgi:hypothetical protein